MAFGDWARETEESRVKVTEQPIMEVIGDAEKGLGNVMVVNQDVKPIVLVPGDLVGEVGPPDKEAILMRLEGGRPACAAGGRVGPQASTRMGDRF